MRHAVLLVQPEGVIDARLAFGQISLCECFDLVERLEVFQCMCGPPAWFLHALEGIHEGTPGVGQATKVRRTFERAPCGISNRSSADLCSRRGTPGDIAERAPAGSRTARRVQSSLQRYGTPTCTTCSGRLCPAP
jgi:hypothetical protein